ncbi:MAG TPA: TauD/TfdA family dioxygenase, partial [Acetobacteraceae bacterium]|nr:TauD/TfdA family dioxygenase [Acetobacteraceae bacterium]
YQTNRALEYHTDSCDVVGLLCLRTSKSGGESCIVSSVTLHDEMLRRSPEGWRALFNAFPTDRRGEVPPGMLPWFEVPVFNWYEEQLSTIYSGQYIRSAQSNFPEARRLTEAERDALALLDAMTNDPALHLKLEFRPGDMQFLHNHQILHSRTDFEDWPEPERRRHLLRLWLAPREGRPLPPAFAQRYGALTPGDRGGIIVRDTVLTFSLEPQ